MVSFKILINSINDHSYVWLSITKHDFLISWVLPINNVYMNNSLRFIFRSPVPCVASENCSFFVVNLYCEHNFKWFPLWPRMHRSQWIWTSGNVIPWESQMRKKQVRSNTTNSKIERILIVGVFMNAKYNKKSVLFVLLVFFFLSIVCHRFSN